MSKISININNNKKIVTFAVYFYAKATKSPNDKAKYYG